MTQLNSLGIFYIQGWGIKDKNLGIWHMSQVNTRLVDGYYTRLVDSKYRLTLLMVSTYHMAISMLMSGKQIL